VRKCLFIPLCLFFLSLTPCSTPPTQPPPPLPGSPPLFILPFHAARVRLLSDRSASTGSSKRLGRGAARLSTVTRHSQVTAPPPRFMNFFAQCHGICRRRQPNPSIFAAHARLEPDVDAFIMEISFETPRASPIIHSCHLYFTRVVQLCAFPSHIPPAVLSAKDSIQRYFRLWLIPTHLAAK
jgi:hypothetical protein